MFRDRNKSQQNIPILTFIMEASLEVILVLRWTWNRLEDDSGTCFFIFLNNGKRWYFNCLAVKLHSSIIVSISCSRLVLLLSVLFPISFLRKVLEFIVLSLLIREILILVIIVSTGRSVCARI